MNNPNNGLSQLMAANAPQNISGDHSQLKQIYAKAMQDPKFAMERGLNSYSAMTKLQELTAMEQAGVNQQALQGGTQPSVAERTLAEAGVSTQAPQTQEPVLMAAAGGITSLAGGGIIGSEEAYAAGGIIAFDEGGDVQGYARKGFVELSDAEIQRLTPAELTEYNNRRYAANQQSLIGGAKKAGAAALDYMTMTPRAIYNLGSDVGSFYGEGINSLAGRQIIDTAPGPGYTSMFPFSDKYSKSNQEVGGQPAAAEKPMVMASEQPNQAQMMANMEAAKLRDAIAAGKYQQPDLSTQKTNLPAALRDRAPTAAPMQQPQGIQELMFTPTASRAGDIEITPDVDARTAMDEYRGLVGTNPFQAKAAEKLAGMEQANELYKQQYPWMALAEAGFGMAAGKSPNALSNIAEGGMRGVSALAKGRETLRESEDKIFNAQAKVAEAQRAEDIAAAKHGVDSSQAAKAARRADKARVLEYEATREYRNKSMEMDTKKANIANALERQKMADEKDYRAKSLKVQREIGNKTPAEIQLIERYAASRNIPFDQAFEEIQQGKNEPKSDTAIAKVLIAGDSTLIDNPDRLTAAIQNYKSALSGYSTAKGDALVDKYKTK